MNKPEHTDMNMVSGDETWIHYFETVREIGKKIRLADEHSRRQLPKEP